MIIDTVKNTVCPDNNCYLIRDIDNIYIFEPFKLGIFEINGQIYNLTASNFKEYEHQ